MKKIHLALIASLVAGFAIAAVTLRTLAPPTPSETAASAYFDQSAATEERLLALEAAVAEERNARQLLEDELLALYEELDAVRDAPPAPAPESRQTVTADTVEADRIQTFRQRARMLNSATGRREALVAAGFAEDRAAWIVKREDELRLEAMQARFDAQRSGDPQALVMANSFGEFGMRDLLGDREYEQYLEAYGRPTTVGVGAVIESSPGQLAGLQAGDEIVRYDGERVFSYSDINNRQLQGEAGESIVVDILRDGTPMQIVMPRGPIGIQAGRFRGR